MKYLIREYKAYPWTLRDNKAFRGYFIVNENLYSGADAITYLEQIVGTETMHSQLSALDGAFVFIIEKKGKVYFGVDRVRSMPLLYSIIEGQLYVGDDADAIISFHKEKKINTLALQEFRDTYTLVTGNDTLIENLFQVRASEVAIF